MTVGNSKRAGWSVRALVAMLVVLAFLSLPEGSAAAQEEGGSHLTVVVVPSILPADGGEYPSLFVQLVGADGTPVQPEREVTLLLTSSTSQTASVPAQATVRPGSSYAQVAVTTTIYPGSSKLTGCAADYGCASADVQTTSPLGAAPPYRVQVYALPKVLYAGASGVLALALVGEKDVPVLAPADVSVVLTSSNPEVVRVAPRVVIPARQYVARLQWQALQVGEASLLAQAGGFEVGSGKVQVMDQGDKAVGLVAFAVPPSFPAGTGDRSGLLLQALDAKGRPTTFPCTPINLTSSAPSAVNLESPLTAPCGPASPYFVQPVVSSGLPGTAYITAGATGLSSATVSFSTYGITPTSIGVQRAPPLALALDSIPAVIVVQLLGDSQRPVVFHQPVKVSLSARGGEVPAEVEVPSGKSFVMVRAVPNASAAELSVTALSPGIGLGSVAFQLKARPLDITLEGPSQPASPGVVVRVKARVTSGDTPVAEAQVRWESPNALPSPVTTTTDANGMAYLTVPLKGTGPVAVSASAFLRGYAQAKATVTVAPAAASSQAGGRSRLPYVAILVVAVALLALYVLYPKLKRRSPPQDQHQP